MKRVDFFVSEREIERLCKAIRQAGAPGYSVMRHVTGWGVAGEISEAMDFSGLGANAHVVVFCGARTLWRGGICLGGRKVLGHPHGGGHPLASACARGVACAGKRDAARGSAGWRGREDRPEGLVAQQFLRIVSAA